MAVKPETDPVTGVDTTGHEWDGIKELNNPIPKPVFWFLGGTGLFALLLWLLYPAIPFGSDFTRGVLGHSTRAAVNEAVDSGVNQRKTVFADLLTANLDELVDNKEARALYEPAAAVLYQENCAACHRTDMKGQTNFPNLVDDHWLWPSNPEEIAITLRYGINGPHDETRYAVMSAFGRDGLLERDQIHDVVAHVRNIAGFDHDAEKAARGVEIFAENCSSCHGDNGEGNLENGAPSLIDKAWIYGSTRETIFQTIWAGRQGHMPHWEGRLSEADIRKLALFVKWRSLDEKADAGS